MAREYSPNSFANKYGYFVIFPLRFSLIGKIKRSFNGDGGYSRNLRITFIDCAKHFLFETGDSNESRTSVAPAFSTLHECFEKSRTVDNLVERSPLLCRLMFMFCPSSLFHISFGVGYPSALHVSVIFWFSRTATVLSVDNESKMLGGTWG